MDVEFKMEKWMGVDLLMNELLIDQEYDYGKSKKQNPKTKENPNCQIPKFSFFDPNIVIEINL